MKPIKLIISAIGPYAREMPMIDFKQFEEKGLFLVSGDTGAGKTTIFDAICFALYGTATAQRKDTRNLRSEYAADSVNSFVDFYFSHQGHEYHVWRQPEYERKKQRGEGMVTEKARAVLYEDGKAPIEGLTQVNSAIIDLLHINYNQFKQIAMIAQGEFWELLNAKTDQRTEILRTIFMTNGYKNIEFILKRRLDMYSDRKEETERSILQYFGDVAADENDEIAKELEDLQERTSRTGSAWNLDELLDMIDRIRSSEEEKLKGIEEGLKKAEGELDRNKNELARAETNNRFLERLAALEAEQARLAEQRAEIDEFEARLTGQKAATREVKPVYDAWKKAAADTETTGKNIAEKEAGREKAKEAAEAAGKELTLAEARRPEVDALKNLIVKITDEEPKYRQRDELRQKLDELTKRKETLTEEDKELKAFENELKGKIVSLKKAIEELKGRPAELQKVQSEGKELTALQDDIKEILNKQIPEREERKKVLKKKQEVYLTSFEAYETAVKERIKAEKDLESSRAGILAKHLKEGEKCPVCGSTHHPEPAKLPDNSVTEDEYEELKKTEEELQNKKAEANTAAEKAKTALEEYEEQMREYATGCLENDHISMNAEGKSLDELISLVKEANETVRSRNEENTKLQITIKKECDRLSSAEKELDEATGSRSEKLEESKADLALRINNTEKSLSETGATLETLKDLKYKDREEAAKEKASAEKSLKEISDSIDSALKAKTEADKEVAAIEAQLKTLADNLSTQKKDEQEFRNALDKKLKEQKFESVSDVIDLFASEDDLVESDKKLNAYKQQVATNKTQLLEARADAEGRTLIDVGALQAVCEEQTKVINDIRAAKNSVANRIANNSEKQKNITARREDLENSKKEFTISKRLYDLVRGTTSNGKITLEQYIQAAGFDGIIAAANRRLLPMSDGQYELYRQEDSLGRRSNTFLDLEVLDNFTGHRRPVANLSGGESFKASLSLALGLSDTVSSNLGGIQMDALFVDEGFGTLDRKSIEGAMDILINLSGANKLVGVISHREELIENIQQQIRVRKTKEGSTFDIDVGI